MSERTRINKKIHYGIFIIATITTESEWRTSGLHIILQRSANFFPISDPGDSDRILKPALTKLQTFPQVSLLKYTSKSAVKCVMVYITEVLDLAFYLRSEFTFFDLEARELCPLFL